jgi:hypothetical protein
MANQQPQIPHPFPFASPPSAAALQQFLRDHPNMTAREASDLRACLFASAYIHYLLCMSGSIYLFLFPLQVWTTFHRDKVLCLCISFFAHGLLCFISIPRDRTRYRLALMLNGADGRTGASRAEALAHVGATVWVAVMEGFWAVYCALLLFSGWVEGKW